MLECVGKGLGDELELIGCGFELGGVFGLDVAQAGVLLQRLGLAVPVGYVGLQAAGCVVGILPAFGGEQLDALG